MSDYRVEHDLLGEKEVPAEAYYGIQTERAMENFLITGVPISQYPELIRALAMIKLAAARANHDCGNLNQEVLRGIEGACDEIIDGALHDQFPVDVIQGGAGTSTNMNANEVIANRALELMGHAKGDYRHCDPHDHVNRSQSTNDAYPSALHVAISLGNTRLIAELAALVGSLRGKGEEFASVLKMGRTQMQDAVPMTLGQEFDAWAESLGNEITALAEVEDVLLEVNMGGTAIGTGLNAPEGYAERCVEHLAEITANEDVCREYIERSIGVVTALNPVLGYDTTTELAKEALETGRGIVELVREKKLLSEEELEAVMDPARMTGSRRKQSSE